MRYSVILCMAVVFGSLAADAGVDGALGAADPSISGQTSLDPRDLPIPEDILAQAPETWRGETRGAIIDVYLKMTLKLTDDGNFVEAQKYAESAPYFAREFFPSPHPHIAQSLNNLAEVYRLTLRYADAERLYKDSLQMDHLVYPDDKFPKGHPDIATTLNNLALLYCETQRYAEAEPLYKQALSMRRRVYAQDEFPEGHPGIAASLEHLGMLYGMTLRYVDAAPLLEEALAMLRRVCSGNKLPECHRQLAECLKNVAYFHKSRWQYVEAERLYSEALTLYRRIYPKEDFPHGHPEIANGLNNLGVLYFSMRRYSDAEPSYQEALAMQRSFYPESDFPEGHPDIACTLGNLAGLCHAMQRYAEATQLNEETLAMLRRLYPESSFPKGYPQLAAGLDGLAELYHAMRRDAEARQLDVESLTMKRQLYPESEFPQGHPEIAHSLTNLGHVYEAQQWFSDQKRVHQEALAMQRRLYPESQFPKGHPEIASALNDLAWSYEHQQHYAEAESLLREALAMRRQVYPQAAFPDGHEDIADSLNDLALLYRLMDRYTDAEPLYQEALAMRRRVYPKTVFPKGHSAIAASLNNLGLLYQLMKRHTEAESWYSEALAMYRCVYPERDFPHGTPEVAACLNNLASLYNDMNDMEHYRQAEGLLKEDLNILRRLYPEDEFPNGCREIAAAKTNLASTLESMQRTDEAESLLKEALSMWRGLYPESEYREGHPEVALSLQNLARLYESKQRCAEAKPLLEEALTITRNSLGSLLIGLSARSQESVLGSFYFSGRYATSAVEFEKTGMGGARLGLDAALTFKGLLSDVSAQERSWGADQGSKTWQEAFDRVENLRQEKAALEAGLQSTPSVQHLQEQLERVNMDLDGAEQVLERESLVFARAKSLLKVTTEDISKCLSPDALLLEFVHYRRYDSAQSAYHEAHYVVYVLGPNWAEPVLVDLGKAEPIDTLILQWRQQLERDNRDFVEKKIVSALDLEHEKVLAHLSRRISDLLLTPVRRTVDPPAKVHLIIGPDGDLAFLPFEALVTSPEDQTPIRYLVEDHPITYVVSGRDVKAWTLKTPSATAPALLVGDPDYDLTGIAFEEMPKHIASVLGRLKVDPEHSKSNTSVAEALKTGAAPSTADLASLHEDLVATPYLARVTTAGTTPCWPENGWTSLHEYGRPLTDAIASAMGESDIRIRGPFMREAALEELLKSRAAPKMLILATHGYCCNAEEWQQFIDAQRKDLQSQFPNDTPALPMERNPLLSAGLVFAGANTLPRKLAATQKIQEAGPTSAHIDDGNLTALEVAALNLHGTELVSLIACKTGLGDTNSATGVLGLRSAFRRAGAEALQMSLFDVLVWPRGLDNRGGDRPDGVTYAQHFFAYWKGGTGIPKSQAHRQAQLDLLKAARENDDMPPEERSTHPCYWAPFVLIGDPN